MALNDGLVAYWKLDENAANTNVAASYGICSGTSNVNTSNLYFAAGKIDSCFDFDGSTEYVQIGNNQNLNISGTGLSLQAWINRDTDSTYEMIMGNGGGYNRAGYHMLSHADGSIRFEINGNYYDTSVLSNSTWHHVVCTYDGAWVKQYIDGVLNMSGARTAVIGSQAGPFGLANGLYTGYGGGLYDGRLDEPAVWNRALTLEEVETLYNSGSGYAIPLATNWLETASDSFSFTDNTISQAIFNRTLSETQNISDDPLSAAGFNKTASDTQGITDNQASVAQYNRSLSDTQGITDNLIKSVFKSISEAFGIDENLVKQSIYNLALSDTENISDDVLVNNAENYVRSLFDTHTISDETTTQANFNRILEELQTMAEALSLPGTSLLADTIQISDDLVATLTGAVSLTSLIIKDFNKRIALKASDNSITLKTSLNRPPFLIPTNHYKCEDDTDDRIVIDSIGNKNGLVTVNKTTSIMSVEGKIGKALECNGTDNYFINTALRFTPPYTISVWAKMPNLASANTRPIQIFGEAQVFSYQRGSGLCVATHNNKFNLYFVNSVFERKDIFSNEIMKVDTWYHITGTIDENWNMKMYINGVLQNDTDRQTGIMPTDIGYVSTGIEFGEYNSVTVDDMRYYDSVISQKDINDIYNAGVGTQETINLPQYIIKGSSGITLKTTLNKIIIKEAK